MIRDIVVEKSKSHDLVNLPIVQQQEFLNELMSSEYTEEKLAAIIYLQLNLKQFEISILLDQIEIWLDKEWIFDWNVCDWMCVRLLSPALDSFPDEVAHRLNDWSKAEYLWKARSSLVPFAQAKSLTDHLQLVEKISIALINRQERFSKTAVGWVLREIYKFNPRFVDEFLETFHEQVTPEVRKNALKYAKK